jgi:hypothetical protein
MADQPWHDLPPEIARVLRPSLPALTEEIVMAVGTIPAYSRPLEGRLGDGIRTGVQQALRHFLDEIESGGHVERPDVYGALGRGEMRAGRSLDALLSAYRIGARVAWRGFAATGEAAGLDPHTLYRLAESLFAYVDALSSESAGGHAREQAARAGERELARRRLARLLLSEVPEAGQMEAAAREADWTLPRSLAVLALAETFGRSRGSEAALVARLPPEVLIGTVDGLTCVLVPDPEAPGRQAELERAVTTAAPDGRAALGPAGPWSEAPASLARARAVLGLDWEAPGLRVAAELTGELILTADRRLAAELAAARLAPLEGLSPGARQRMRDTLRAWLDEQGRLGAVAARLGVHPQTARYRIGRLRERFGAALDDPDERFWLALALRAEGASAERGATGER